MIYFHKAKQYITLINLKELIVLQASVEIPVLSQSSAQSVKAEVQPYYRSRLFTVHTGLNPLITAAAPLLTMLTSLQDPQQKIDLDEFQITLNHELKAFESSTRLEHYEQHSIMLARYILASSIDILRSLYTQKSKRNHPQRPASISLDNYLLLIEHLLKESDKNCDLLELIYLCISLSLVDHTSITKVETHKRIIKICDAIYQLSVETRQTKLLPTLPDIAIAETKPSNTLLWITAAVVLALITCLMLSDLFMGNLTNHLTHEVQQLDQYLHQTINTQSE